MSELRGAEEIEIVGEHVEVGNRKTPPGTKVQVSEIGEGTAQDLCHTGQAKRVPLKETRGE